VASVQHLGGDRWRVRVHVAGGRTISRSFIATGKRDVDRKVAAVEAELRKTAARVTDEAAERRGCVAELVDDWLKVKSLTNSPSTLIAYRRHAAAIKSRFGHLKAAELTGREIDAWYADLREQGATDAGIVVARRHLRVVLRFGYTKRGLASVATDRATPARHEPPEPDPPDPDKLVRILLALPGGVWDQWARAVALIVFTGLRRGEIVGLRWDGWDEDAGTLAVVHSVLEVKGGIVVRPTPKGRRIRKVPVVPGAEAILERQREWAAVAGTNSPWVFPDVVADPTGATPRRPGWISLMWARKRAEVDAEGIRLHELRHAFATMLLDRQVPVTTVQRWLGHAKASTTTDVYGHRGDAGELAGRSVLTEDHERVLPGPTGSGPGRTLARC
jgi:integrase